MGTERGSAPGRYVEYGLAEKDGISVAALKNNAGAFVTPWQANITRMGNEIALPPSAASAQWEHVNFLSLGAPGPRPHTRACFVSRPEQTEVIGHALKWRAESGAGAQWARTCTPSAAWSSSCSTSTRPARVRPARVLCRLD